MKIKYDKRIINVNLRGQFTVSEIPSQSTESTATPAVTDSGHLGAAETSCGHDIDPYNLWS